MSSVTFPQTILDIDVELQLAGTWTDITPYAYGREGGGITITRGRTDEGTKVEAGRCSLQLDNRDGRFSPRNPVGAYYGRIGRNTPIRVSAHGGERYLGVTGAAGSQATTPDTTALDIVGDTDLRIELSLDNWNEGSEVKLAGKYRATGEQRSWAWWLDTSNNMVLRWSTDGTLATATTITSTESVNIPPSNRLALRVTLDVNDGEGNGSVIFWTAPTINGPWQQLGSLAAFAATSVFNSTAPVEIGDVTDLTSAVPTGRIYTFELRDRIDGTVVANPDFTTQPAGTTSFTDSAGRTWTVAPAASVSDKKVRFVGEVSEWPARWDTGGDDVYVPIEAAGVLRRLGQGASPLDSTLRRRIPTFSPLAYWPLEDEANTTQAMSPISSVPPMTVSGLTFATDDTLGGSKALPSVAGGTASLRATVPLRSLVVTKWHTEFIYYLATPPSGATTVLRYSTTGTAGLWSVRLQSGTATVLGQDGDGTILFTTTMPITDTDFFGKWVRVQLYAETVSGNINYTLNMINIGGANTTVSATYPGTTGRITGVSSNDVFAAALDGMRLGHIGIFATPGTLAYNGADNGFNAETAINRLTRLGDEEAVEIITYDGDTTTNSEALGPQHPATFLDLCRECEDADGGLLYEERTDIGLTYRDRTSLHNQTPTLTISYTGDDGLVAPLDPTDDDQSVRNDITVQRTGGSSARATLDTGTLSTLAPPNGVGRYADSLTVNVHGDDQPVQIANWLLHLGTWDEARYPTVKLLLQGAPQQIDDAIAVDSGDLIRLTHLPPWLPPDDANLMCQGYTEFLAQYQWEITYNCTPAGPWNVGKVSDPVYGRADTSGSQLAEALTATETGVDVLTTDGPLWVTTAGNPSEFPFDVRVSGERMTVTACGDALADTFTRTVAATATDTFTRTVSNGWGSADTGQAWTTSGGTASDYATTGTAGTHSVGVVNSSRFTTLGAISLADVDMQVDITIPVAAAGASISAGPRLRAADTSNYYYIETKRTTTGTFTIELVSRVAAVSTTIAGPVTVGATSAGDTWTVRARVVGSVLQAKAWKLPGTEPAAWTVEAVTTTLTAAGPVGTRSILSTGNTNTLPVVVTWDNIRVTAVSQGWGTSTSGDAWTTSGGAPSEYFIDQASGEGIIELTSVNSSRRAVTGPNWTDTDLVVAVTVPVVAATDSIDPGIMSRYIDGSNYYLGTLHFHNDSTVDVRIRKNVAGVFTTMSISGLLAGTYAAGSKYWLRFKTAGTALYARGWADGTAEPAFWHATATDTDLTAGGDVGVRANLQVNNTNTLPVTMRFDQFAVKNPQAFTVTRSVNGVTKPHTTGADVRLADPSYISR